MQTTAQWLQGVLASTTRMTHWLSRQYVGEALAASRIAALAKTAPEKHRPSLVKIAEDEARHSTMVQGLLTSRGIPLPTVDYTHDRYWSQVLEADMDFGDVAAAGHHAEEMRLVRIRALSTTEEVPSDIRAVFAAILGDEEWHAAAFAQMTNPAALAEAEANHQKGMEALGLLL